MSRILLVEDDRWLADLEVRSLTEAGHSVTIAFSALEAIDAIDAIDQTDTMLPEAIIVDVLLAGSTAFTLLNELQSHRDTEPIPIILCSTIADQLDPKRLQHYGIKRVVDKTTMQPDDVAAAVKAVL